MLGGGRGIDGKRASKVRGGERRVRLINRLGEKGRGSWAKEAGTGGRQGRARLLHSVQIQARWMAGSSSRCGHFRERFLVGDSRTSCGQFRL